MRDPQVTRHQGLLSYAQRVKSSFANCARIQRQFQPARSKPRSAPSVTISLSARSTSVSLSCGRWHGPEQKLGTRIEAVRSNSELSRIAPVLPLAAGAQRGILRQTDNGNLGLLQESAPAWSHAYAAAAAFEECAFNCWLDN